LPRGEEGAADEGPSGGDAPPATLLVDSGDKWQKLNVRVRSGFLMIGSFVGVVCAGHFFCIALVFVIQVRAPPAGAAPGPAPLPRRALPGHLPTPLRD